MELISSFLSKDNYLKIKDKVDGVAVGYTSFTAYSAINLNKEEILEIAKEKKVFVLLNALLHEFDLEPFKAVINDLKDIDNVFFVVADLGAISILKKMNLSSRTIYQPETMITNYMDALEYQGDNLYALSVSNEITVEDASIIMDKIPNAYYLGYGYHPMYRSYRKIVSLWKENRNLEFENGNMFLQEVTRKDMYPLIENEYESVVFRGGVINVIKEIDKVSNAKVLFLDGIFLDENKFTQVVDTFRKVINKEISSFEGEEIISKLEIKEDNTFMYNDSRYEVE